MVRDIGDAVQELTGGRREAPPGEEEHASEGNRDDQCERGDKLGISLTVVAIQAEAKIWKEQASTAYRSAADGGPRTNE